jgi:hypothetical protein
MSDREDLAEQAAQAMRDNGRIPEPMVLRALSDEHL